MPGLRSAVPEGVAKAIGLIKIVKNLSKAQIHVEAWKKSFGHLIDQASLEKITFDKRQAQWRKTLPQQGSWTYIYNEDGIIKAFFSMRILEGEKQTLEVNAIYVDPIYQGRGIGKHIFEFIKSFAHDQHYQLIKLWSLIGSDSNGFYSKIGGHSFEETESIIAGVTLPVNGYVWKIV